MGQCVPLQCHYAKTNLHAVIGVSTQSSIKARSVSFVSLSLLERDREKLKEGGGWRGGEEHNTSFYAVIIMMSLLATEHDAAPHNPSCVCSELAHFGLLFLAEMQKRKYYINIYKNKKLYKMYLTSGCRRFFKETKFKIFISYVYYKKS